MKEKYNMENIGADTKGFATLRHVYADSRQERMMFGVRLGKYAFSTASASVAALLRATFKYVKPQVNGDDPVIIRDFIVFTLTHNNLRPDKLAETFMAWVGGDKELINTYEAAIAGKKKKQWSVEL